MTDELELDEIFNVTETNYSVGQIENSTTNSSFIQDTLVVSTFYKK